MKEEGNKIVIALRVTESPIMLSFMGALQSSALFI